ncbi:MAG TPA: hypothetical protein VNT03_00880 [Baekduia sp.]|nr:hypothetical protein [Baekduia sp.]
MSVVIRYQPRDLTRQQYDEVSRRMEGSGSWPPDGMDMHVLFGAEGELRVSEIWDSEEKWRTFRDKLVPVLQEVGVQMGGDPEVFQVHELQKREGARA